MILKAESSPWSYIEIFSKLHLKLLDRLTPAPSNFPDPVISLAFTCEAISYFCCLCNAIWTNLLKHILHVSTGWCVSRATDPCRHKSLPNWYVKVPDFGKTSWCIHGNPRISSCASEKSARCTVIVKNQDYHATSKSMLFNNKLEEKLSRAAGFWSSLSASKSGFEPCLLPSAMQGGGLPLPVSFF